VARHRGWRGGRASVAGESRRAALPRLAAEVHLARPALPTEEEQGKRHRAPSLLEAPREIGQEGGAADLLHPPAPDPSTPGDPPPLAGAGGWGAREEVTAELPRAGTPQDPARCDGWREGAAPHLVALPASSGKSSRVGRGWPDGVGGGREVGGKEREGAWEGKGPGDKKRWAPQQLVGIGYEI
jgi:hypothetical protein